MNLSPGQLRITVGRTPTLLTLRIEGKIAGHAVEELQKQWSALADGLGARKLIVDLREATGIDHAGIQALADIHRQGGAQFQTDSPLTQYFAERATGFYTKSGKHQGANYA